MRHTTTLSLYPSIVAARQLYEREYYKSPRGLYVQLSHPLPVKHRLYDDALIGSESILAALVIGQELNSRSCDWSAGWYRIGMLSGCWSPRGLYICRVLLYEVSGR